MFTLVYLQMVLSCFNARFLSTVHIHVGVQERHVSSGRRTMLCACLVNTKKRLQQIFTSRQFSSALFLFTNRRTFCLRNSGQQQLGYLIKATSTKEISLRYFYRPQLSWAKVMFLQVCVILFTGGGLPQYMLGYHIPPLGADTSPVADTPQSRQPPRAGIPPGSRPPREADSGIRSTSGRYASYWNAFLLYFLLLRAYSQQAKAGAKAKKIKE